MRTKFAIISRLSADNPEMVFNQLMHHFNKENLLSWYPSLKGKAAVGIDGMTKDFEYLIIQRYNREPIALIGHDGF